MLEGLPPAANAADLPRPTFAGHATPAVVPWDGSAAHEAERLRAVERGYGAGADCGGEREWFEHLFRAHYTGLCSFVVRYVGSRDAAKDVVQDLLFSVWEDRHHWAASEKALVPTLYTAARNRALNAVKRAQIGDRSCARADWARRPTAGADYALLTGEVHAAIERAVDSLPERCRLVFTLSRGRGLTYEEIAAALGLSVKTVETQMGRALKALRTRLAPYLTTVTLLVSASLAARIAPALLR